MQRYLLVRWLALVGAVLVSLVAHGISGAF